MSEELARVEVLDPERRPVRRRRSLGPTNAAMFVLAVFAAFGILLLAVGTVLRERARGLTGRRSP